MFSVIVICTASQTQNLNEILIALSKQSELPDHVCVVFEGPEELYWSLQTTCAEFGIEFVRSIHKFVGFSAGANRDAGIQFITKHYGTSDFLFLDGDCVPSPDLIKHHRCILDSSNGPAIGCGLRRNRTSHGLVADRRLNHPATRMRLYVNGLDRLLINPKEIIAHSAVWSCNMSLNREAVDLIVKANQLVWPDTGRLFAPGFDGMWGGEDTLIGVFGFRTGCKIILMNPTVSWVEHIDHVTAYTASDNLVACTGYDKTVQTHMPRSCKIQILKRGTLEPVPDTKIFYSSIVGTVMEDSRVVGLCKHLHVTDPGEIAVLHFLFGSNPEINYVAEVEIEQLHPVSVTRVLELFNTVRLTPIDFKSL
jgi:hypothetical protein